MKKIYTLLLGILFTACQHAPHDVQQVNELPSIYPDYIGVTIPMGIAPLNFNLPHADELHVTIKGANGTMLTTQGKWAEFDIRKWHQLLDKNQGKELKVSVCSRENGQWRQYQEFSIYVSASKLDEYGLTYRRIAPGYEVYGKMGLYQRDLSSFQEDAIFENTEVPGACVNCHTSNQTSNMDFLFHVRGTHGATVIQQNGKPKVLNTKTEQTLGLCVYPYWHPSGKYVAFSTNTTRQSFHVTRDERIEVFDQASDLQVYKPDTHELLLSPLLKGDDMWETFPAFSPDGQTLYFCRAVPKAIPEEYKEVRYNLCKISFNPENESFGTRVDTVLIGDSFGKSITMPRPSYDGKYLMYTLSDYGTFPIWHRDADLYLLDLHTGENRAIAEINSEDTESFHNWSTNSHWVVFSSRRDGGLYTRLYLTSMDEQGHFTKPFLLPQKNPLQYYDELMDSYNVPDFVKAPVQLDANGLARTISSDKRIDLKAVVK